MTTTTRADAGTPAEYELAEGILWDDRAGLVRWVDIWKGRVLSGRLNGDQLTVVDDVNLGQTTGAVALAEDGGLLVAGARGLITISPNGDVLAGPDLLGERANARLNDGTVDPFGNFVGGSAAIGELTHGEVLVRVSPDGTVDTLRDGLQLSNGIAFSPDGATIYHVDTYAGTVASHSYGRNPLDVAEPWVTVLDDLPAHPDGLTVDAEGALWVALWGGARVNRYLPAGTLLATVEVDASQPSCPGFIGDALDILAITSGQEGLESFSDRSGAIFLADVGVRGLPPHRWAGSTSAPFWVINEGDNPR